MNHRVVICLFCLILVGSHACKKSPFKSIDEGEIHYKISIQNRNAILPDEFMPTHMIVKFKDDKIMMDISSPVGNNGISNIIYPGKNEIRTFFRVMGIKYYYLGTTDEVFPGIDPMPDMEIENTGQVSTILKLECKKSVVTLPEKDFSYELWHTEDIDIDRPNIASPFEDIKGVLMNFFFLMGDMTVEFEAEAIYLQPVPDKVFEEKENYRRISRKSMDELIASMMSL